MSRLSRATRTGAPACALIIVLAAVVYLPVLTHDFVYDDIGYVTDNPFIQRGLTTETVARALTSSYAGHWHPLTWISHMIDCELFGPDPSGHHAVNLLFHLVNACLLFTVLVRLTGSVWRTAVVTALFALHPINVESVAWVAERKNLLSAFFWFLTMHSYVSYARSRSRGRYLLTLLLFTTGLFAKAILVTLPFVLLLLDYWPLGRVDGDRGARGAGRVGRLVLEKIPFFAVSGVVSALAYLSIEGTGTLMDIGLDVRLGNVVVSYVTYIRKLIIPVDLAVFYPHPLDRLPLWTVIGSVLLILLLLFPAVRYVRRSPAFAVGVFWYLGILVPVIGLVQQGAQALADRYLYLPAVGLFTGFVWVIAGWAAGNRFRVSLSAVLSIGIVVACFFATRRQVGFWQDEIRLFRHAIHVTTGNYVAHNNLGIALDRQGRTSEALEHFRRATEIKPTYAEPYVNRGFALARTGNFEAAIREYRRALAVNRNQPRAHYNLGVALHRTGEFDEALEHFENALSLNPSDPDILFARGQSLAALGRTEEAKECLFDVLERAPHHAGAHNSLGLLLAGEGKREEAERHFMEAVRLKPGFRAARENLRALRADTGAGVP